MSTYRLLIIIASFALVFSACSSSANQNTASEPAANTSAEANPGPTPSNKITDADVAKLKWLEGSWRGMDGDKPFYERFRFEGSTMIVETLEDGDLSKVTEAGRFELKDGEFGQTIGDSRSAASEITDDSIQFVPSKIPGSPEDKAPKGPSYRFKREADGTWSATLQTQASRGQAASEKTYKMEPWKGK